MLPTHTSPARNALMRVRLLDNVQGQDFRQPCDEAFQSISTLSLLLFSVCIVLPPILFAVYIQHLQKRGQLSQPRTRCHVGFLLSGYFDPDASQYDGQFPFWESAVMLRRIGISAIAALVIERPDLQVNQS